MRLKHPCTYLLTRAYALEPKIPTGIHSAQGSLSRRLQPLRYTQWTSVALQPSNARLVCGSRSITLFSEMFQLKRREWPTAVCV